MIYAKDKVLINKSAKEVFSFLADGTNNPKWRLDVIDIKKASGDGGVGTVFQQAMSGPFGMKIQGDYTITEYQPDSLLAFQVIAGPARPKGVFRLKPEDSATELTFELSLEPKGLLAKILSPMVAKQMQAEMANLKNLKKALDS